MRRKFSLPYLSLPGLISRTCYASVLSVPKDTSAEPRANVHLSPAMTTQAREEALSKIPLGRFGSVDEIADAAVFLASNAYANNCAINLDGGLSAV